ncbi:MAG: cobalamin B12-binding domain-containing protein [Candidatus Thorarchaeota archaeon]
MSNKDTLTELRDAIIKGNRKVAPNQARQLLDEGKDAYSIVIDGCSKAMIRVGELYQEGEYFVPEILMSAKAFEAVMEIIKPHLQKSEQRASGTIVIGVCEGDIHSIGKNIVSTMLQAAGFKMIDLGKDVPVNEFIEAAKENDADIIAVSALMTNSMLGMKDVIDAVKSSGINPKIMIGGGPVSAEYAKQIGADGFGQDAKEAVDVALKLMEVQ